MNSVAAVKPSLQPTSQVLRILEGYLEELEHGGQPNPDALVARHPELADPLRACLASLEFLHGAALSLRGSGAPVSATAVPELGRLGDFRLRREVGRGGMGVVYEAEQISLGRRVALKVLPVEAARDAKLLARFRREAQAAAQLHHTNIVPVFEVGQEGEIFFYAMQYIQGQPLDAVIQELQRLRAASGGTPCPDVAAAASAVARSLLTGQFEPMRSGDATVDSDPEPDKPPLTVRPAADAPVPAALPGQSELSIVESDYPLYCRNIARISLQVAEALAHAHSRGIVHRDIKPSNLLLDSAGSAWVSDFGLAKTQEQALTETGDLVGTVRYMAPERFQGVCDAQADVYGLGLTLYELLLLRPVFDAPDRLRLLDQIGHQEPARPRVIDARVPRDLETILMKAIEKEPRRRYASAEALAGDLRRFLADEPIQARRIGPLERLGRWGRRNPLVAGLSAAIVLVTALGFVGVLGQWQVALANEQQANANAAQAQEKEREANQQRDEAQRQRDEVRALNDRLQRTLYTAHMNLAQHTWEAGGTGQVRELLEQHRPKPGETDLRGFEWYYLDRLWHSDLLTLKGHTNDVNSVAYSPDGKRLASTSYDHTVKVWDAQTGQELLSLKGHTGTVESVAYSPDGKRLASASYDHTVKVWDAQTGQELLSLKGHTAPVNSVAFSPDGKRLASGGTQEVKVWDAQTGQELLTIKGRAGSVAFSPDGKRLASAGGEVKVWDAQTGQELLSLQGGFYRVAFSPDGKRLASPAQGGVKVWDAQTGQELLTLWGHTAGVYSVAFSPDGKRLASSSQDGVKVRDAQTGQELLALKGASRSVAFSPDGKRLASASGDGTVKIWDATTSPEARAFSGHTGVVGSVAYSPDGKRLASASNQDNTAKVWDVQTGQELLSFKGARGRVAFSPDGKRLACASPDETVKVWDAQTGQVLLTFKGHIASVRSVAFSPDGKRLASPAQGGVKVWDAQTGQELLALQGHTGRVASVAFSPDGKRLASGGTPEVKVWDAQTGQELLTFKGHGGPVRSLAFSPDGKRLASADADWKDPMVKVWDAQTGQELRVLKGHTNQVMDVAFSPDGKRLASAANDPTVKVWDAQTGQELLTLQGHNNGLSSIAFSPDGHHLASGGAGGTVKIWDATPLPEKP